MTLYIKYMISLRCKMAVKEALRELGLHFVIVDLGEVEIMETINDEERNNLKAALLKLGLELMDDKKAVLIQGIKRIINETVLQPDEGVKLKFSKFLSERLGCDYTYLSHIFSEVQGVTIEQFMIAVKVERIKELIIYDEMNLTEIAWKMNYSSVAHLSNQFKKATGLSPSHFKEMKRIRQLSAVA